ncbi:hypothetical protein AYI70_g6796 [Smittium culicis]|uniref:Inositolphosphotransferase Aur1/Ipt1 domain-containing protein n=1 Tax=Smittium culicis TaxID=133412 RepID=A0A1R1XNC9_9FUNG|nr:hypothetical protein AYI70_g6796 [Smittium culicis]
MVFLATEVVLIALAFTTNFVSAFFHSNFLDFDFFKSVATKNALNIVEIEKFFGLFFEQSLQKWTIENIGGWQFWNSYYAAAHPVVAILTIVFILVRAIHWSTSHYNWTRVEQSDFSDLPSQSSYFVDGSKRKESLIKRLFFKRQVLKLNPLEQYRFLRNIYLISILISVFGYILLPTMPPRLLNNCDFFNHNGKLLGGCLPQFNFIDTIDKHGSLFFSWKDESIQVLNNPYAALPSQHALVAAYVAIVWIVFLFSNSKSSGSNFKSKKSLVAFSSLISLAVFYPLLTLFCIIVTANHFIFDAIMGFTILSSATLFSLFLLNRCSNSYSKLSEDLPI